MPEKSLIHWVIIKEPNKLIRSEGRVYVLLESVDEPKYNLFARFFGYQHEKIEPRLYGLKYTRQLHEQIEKGLMGRLRKGQPVSGRFIKTKGDGEGRNKGNGSEKGGGSESQEQEWEFHELLPSEIHQKPTR
jgi:hypothetical protein